jgi:hypothetical protein
MKTATIYIFPMRKKEHSREVIRMRSKGEYLGKISAADEATALKLAIKEFELSEVDGKRLLIRRE